MSPPAIDRNASWSAQGSIDSSILVDLGVFENSRFFNVALFVTNQVVERSGTKSKAPAPVVEAFGGFGGPLQVGGQ